MHSVIELINEYDIVLFLPAIIKVFWAGSQNLLWFDQ